MIELDDVVLEEVGLDDVELVGLVSVDVVDVALDEVVFSLLSEGKLMSFSLRVKSIVLLTLVFTLLENDESISMKIETQAAAARDSNPFLKTFCFEGMSFFISKIAFILTSFSRILKKFSVCRIPESFRSSSLT